MSSRFVLTADLGRALYGTLQQMASNGTLGQYWDVVGASWATSVTNARRKVTITEGSGIDAGSYTGGTGQLGTYSGYALKRVHDTNQGDRVIGVTIADIRNGVEIDYALSTDVAMLPAATYVYAESQGGFTSSNMRGTDNAMLAASYVAPNNSVLTNVAAEVSTCLAQATLANQNSGAAKVAAESIDSRVTFARAANLDKIDVVLSTRSSHSAADVRNLLNSQPVPASNMRGTDNALLAADYVSPANSTISAANVAAAAAKTASETLVTLLTPTRAGYLDNLSAGPVATQSTVSAITNTTRLKIVTPSEVVIPSSGSVSYVVDLFLYDSSGNMEAADATPTFTAENAAAASRSGNLSSVTNPATGQYRVTYTVSSSHAEEQIVIRASVSEAGATLIGTASILVVATASSGGFTSTDRTWLQAMYNKLPTRPYLVGTDASDGDINLDNCDGSRAPFKADVSALASQSSIDALPAATRTYLNSNPVPASNMRGTDSALLAANYTAPDNAGITTAATQATNANNNATTAATQATTAAATAASIDGKLTITRAGKLDNLDVAVSTRSSFNASSTGVILAAGHGLATDAQAVAIKAKTDLIPATPPAIADIPTASQVATQVNSTLTTAHGSGNWAATSDATAAKQDQILALIAGIVPSPASSVVSVSAQRTWRLLSDGEQSVAPNIVTLAAGTTAVLAMDFCELLNEGTGISAVGAVTDTSGLGLVPTSLLPSQDRECAHFTVTGLTANNRHTIKVTVATSDGQTLTGSGVLMVQ